MIEEDVRRQEGLTILNFRKSTSERVGHMHLKSEYEVDIFTLTLFRLLLCIWTFQQDLFKFLLWRSNIILSSSIDENVFLA